MYGTCFQFLHSEILNQCTRFGQLDSFAEACELRANPVYNCQCERNYLWRSIYAIGDCSADFTESETLTIERYDIDTRLSSWERVNQAHGGRTSFSTSIIGDEIYLIGGWGGVGPKKEVSVSRDRFYAMLYWILVIEHRICFFFLPFFLLCRQVDCLSLKTMRWQSLRSMRTARYSHTAVVLDSSIYVLGGFSNVAER